MKLSFSSRAEGKSGQRLQRILAHYGLRVRILVDGVPQRKVFFVDTEFGDHEGKVIGQCRRFALDADGKHIREGRDVKTETVHGVITLELVPVE